jgi:hypothetical protein
MAREDPNPFDFDATEPVAPIRQLAENTIARHARRSCIVLCFVGGLQLVFMFLVFVPSGINWLWAVNPENLIFHPQFYLWFAAGVILGIFFLVLGFWAQSDPLLPPILGLGLYVGANLLDAILFFDFAITLLPAGPWFWLLRVFIVVLLIDAIRAGLAYFKIVNKLIVEIGDRAARTQR